MEVETTILQNQEVSEVIVRVENEAEIVAFYTTESDPYEDLTQWIETHLPSHMRPRTLVQINQWRRLPNGKVDRKKLISSDFQSSGKTIQTVVNDFNEQETRHHAELAALHTR